MPTSLPARPDLDWLRRRAKERLAQLKTARPGARLAEAQLALAREHGFASWRALKAHVDALRAQRTPPPPPNLPEPVVAAFLRAVGRGDAASVEAALEAYPGFVNVVGPHPYWGGRPQPLHVAIETRRPEIVKLLLAHGADVDGRNADYLHWSPLLLTLHWNQPGVRRMLLRRGARVGLVEALAMGDDRTVLRLLRRGRAALADAAPNGGSLLMFARTPAAIDRLLELGVSVELRDRWGADPIEAFSRLGVRGRPLVRHLLERGIPAPAAVHARLNDRAALRKRLAADPAVVRDPSVLKGAVDFGHHALAEWLLGKGADPNARTGEPDDATVLHSAAWNGDLRMVELLLRHGADPAIRDARYGAGAAGWAAKSVEVTNNPRCAEVAKRIEAWQAGAAGNAEETS